MMQVMEYALSIGFRICELSFSPIKGPEGNIEYLLYLENTDREPEQYSSEQFQQQYQSRIDMVVEEAHQKLDDAPSGH